MLFSDENVAIDTQVSNRARLTKLYGTVAHKGEHSALTPHRTSCFKHVPQEIKPIDKAYFEKIVAAFMTPNTRPSSENNYVRGKFRLESF
ncbi:MAG: hypothetical protein J6Q96_02220, partial [Bacteroidales bacterium]|nr:hypothetical protein [Bacteroidales bacterium]